jgi:hypothetical protein
MIALKWLLVILGIGLFGSAGALVVYDVYLSSQLRKLLQRSSEERMEGVANTAFLPGHPFGPVRWQRALSLAGLAVVPLLVSKSIVVVPDGEAEFWGVRPGPLYPGVHLAFNGVPGNAASDQEGEMAVRRRTWLGRSATTGNRDPGSATSLKPEEKTIVIRNARLVRANA